MKRLFTAVFIAFIALVVNVGDAEAARLGGGRSIGMQRRAVTPQQVTPPARQAAPAQVQPQKRSWMGPIAGLAAGLGLAALFSHLGLGAEFANFVMLMLLVMAASFVFRLLRRPQQATPGQTNGPMQYAGVTPTGTSTANPGYASSDGAMAGAASAIPADFDSESFLRVAKLNFIRLQAANDAKNLDDIREFVTPEIYAEIKLQMDERGNAPQKTDIVTLDAGLLAVVSEDKRYIASVRFGGMIRETDGEAEETAAAPFEEIWNLSKPVDGSSGWVIAGIQQIQ